MIALIQEAVNVDEVLEVLSAVYEAATAQYFDHPSRLLPQGCPISPTISLYKQT